MKKNGALDIIFKIFSILLCIILVPTLIITVIVGTVSNVVKPETLVKVVKTVDVQQIITETPDISQALEEAKIAPEVIEQVLESNVVEQVVSSYAEDLSNYLLTGESSFSAEQIKNILNENKDEVKSVLSAVAPEDVTVEEIEAELDTFINEQIGPMINEVLPKPQEVIQDIPEDVKEVIKVFNSGIVTKICIGACLVLFALILLLRLREYSFLIWYSVVSIITGVFIASIYSGFAMVPSMLPSELPVPLETVQSIISVLTQNMLISFIVLFVLAAICMAGFFLISKYKNKKEQTKEEVSEA
ncbi:MAG: hypothetical protein E7365_04965 [Clostridiales bacterium]|nr:hypothetical protein [Clostridiales bacterium]